MQINQLLVRFNLVLTKKINNKVLKTINEHSLATCSLVSITRVSTE